MNKVHSEEQLQKQYELHKAKFDVPSELDDSVRNYARSIKPSIWRWLNVPAVALSFVAIIVFGIINNNPDVASPNSGSLTANQAEYRNIELIHTVSLTDQNKLAIKESEALKRYLTSLQSLSSVNEIRGVVIEHEQDVKIEVCQLGILQLPTDALFQLGFSELANDFKIGTPIELIANQQGVIDFIQQANDHNDSEKYQCD